MLVKSTTRVFKANELSRPRVYRSNGQVVDSQELSNEETLAPVTQIVKVGTAKPTMIPNDAPKAEALPEYPLTYTDETRVGKINFTIREEETDELVRDARQITTPGVQGERTIKTRVYSSNGQVVDSQELSNEETFGSGKRKSSKSAQLNQPWYQMMHRKQMLCQNIR